MSSFNLRYFSIICNILWSSIQKQPPRGVLKKRCSENMQKFTGEHLSPSVNSIKLQSNFIEITLRHGWCPVNLLHIFRTPFPRNTSGWLLLSVGEIFSSRIASDIVLLILSNFICAQTWLNCIFLASQLLITLILKKQQLPGEAAKLCQMRPTLAVKPTE